jgi:hypothetical protein
MKIEGYYCVNSMIRMFPACSMMISVPTRLTELVAFECIDQLYVTHAFSHSKKSSFVGCIRLRTVAYDCVRLHTIAYGCVRLQTKHYKNPADTRGVF